MVGRKLTEDAKARHRNLMRFSGDGLRFINSGLDDYLLARLGLRNGLFSGMVAAHQAVEKFLKAFRIVLLKSQNLPVEELDKGLKARGAKSRRGLPASHNLLDLYKWCADLQGDAAAAPDILEHLNWCYVHRYPDNPFEPGGSSTEKLHDIDLTMMNIWRWFEPLDDYLYITMGLSEPLFLEFNRGREWDRHHVSLLAADNRVFGAFHANIVPRINALYEP